MTFLWKSLKDAGFFFPQKDQMQNMCEGEKGKDKKKKKQSKPVLCFVFQPAAAEFKMNECHFGVLMLVVFLNKLHIQPIQ